MLGPIFREAYAREHRSLWRRCAARGYELVAALHDGEGVDLPRGSPEHGGTLLKKRTHRLRAKKTLDYGRTINPFATKAFFHSLADSIVIG